ncbi:MAG: PolC-type DNA polymerase III [Evtepia sp.]|uniref:PolC-type DNA polymerase III n=1 Tax=Evtepia sp. TaxID=2773933 RepID=UPI002A754666|nr:PolC-type DNA polymerase III [Evtepia sp.]MDY3014587.1 PolC-type DNA polymerase III [Evtepia sp.]
MPEKNLPFFELFSQYRPDPALAGELSAWLATRAVVDSRARTIEVSLLCPVLPDGALLQQVEADLCRIYGMTACLLHPALAQAPEPVLPAEDVPPVEAAPPVEEVPPAEEIPFPEEAPPEAPPPEDLPPLEEPPMSEQERLFRQTEEMRRKAMAQAMAAQEAQRGFSAKRIYGPRAIKKKPVPMNTLELDMGAVVVEGDVFAVEHRELKKRNAWVVSFDLTDYTSSIRVTKFMPGEEAKPIVDGVKKGMHLKVSGRLNLNRFDNDMVLEPLAIETAEKESRKDEAPEKRVELHLHTRMSLMDALTDTADVVKRAISWGHPAIAITDHGVAQSFPDAYNTGKGKIKVLLGTEAYYLNNVDDKLVVHGDQDQDLDLDGPVVCFDLETTGLSKTEDRITEIGAVILEGGEVKERFQTFANPQKPLPPNIVQLTGITEDMLVGAPSQEEAIQAFLAFADGRPLAAHNAEFDIGFIREGCRRYGIDFQPTVIDTLPLAQKLLPELGKYKLDVVSRHLNLPEFNHHRASDDAAMVGYMLVPFIQILRDRGVNTIGQINPAMARNHTIGKAKRMPKHLIVLAKNQAGLRNLYKLISLGHLKYFKRFPIMPKSEINANREGLILGSACEAGELYQAIVRGKEWEELKRIASWYDFLEIQPLSNNGFMVRPDRNGRTIARDWEQIREWNRTVVRLGEELGKPVCATGDVHFLDPEEEIYRHVLLDTKGFDDADAPNPLYFRTTEEMLAEFSYLGPEKAYEVVVTNTNLVASWCEDVAPLPKGLFAPKLENSAEELHSLVWGKAHELYGEDPPQIVKDRIQLELPGIIERKYDVIYMSAQKLVQNSLENGYLVGSRGSVGSSIVAFLSGITEVNSLPPHYRCPNCKHSDFAAGEGYGCGADMPDGVCPVCGTPYVKDGFNIPFETFLGYGGKKVPDIDLNFSGEYQANAHRYTFELFGENHVFRAGTIGTVAEKTAYGYVKKYLAARGLQVTKAEENRLALGCTGVRRTTGQHPGGMVVIPQDHEIYDFCPVQHPADDTGTDIITTHFDYHKMEDNLLKLDILGHDDPTMIRMMEDLTGVNAQQIPLDDQDTMSLFTTSAALGYEEDPVLGPTGAVAIPEFNTKFTRQMLQDTMPTKFNTLIRLSGFSHGTDVWLGNARDLIVSGTATVDSTVGCRDDIMLYLMEQGVEPKMAFDIMEAVRKGKVKKGGFQEGWEEAMRACDVPDWYIDSLGKIGYLFPKAHAVAYVMMAFRIAWFKVHRPLAFYAAYFSIRAKALDATCMCQGMEVCQQKMREIQAKEKDAAAVEEDMMVTLEVCYEFYLRGFTFATIDLYRSDATKFLMDEESNALLPPFTAIPGLGETAAISIVENREGRHFISQEELLAACPKVSKTHVEQLRAAGALGSMPETSQISLF